jgi:hypothetical protein
MKKRRYEPGTLIYYITECLWIHTRQYIYRTAPVDYNTCLYYSSYGGNVWLHRIWSGTLLTPFEDLSPSWSASDRAMGAPPHNWRKGVSISWWPTGARPMNAKHSTCHWCHVSRPVPLSLFLWTVLELHNRPMMDAWSKNTFPFGGDKPAPSASTGDLGGHTPLSNPVIGLPIPFIILDLVVSCLTRSCVSG